LPTILSILHENEEAEQIAAGNAGWPSQFRFAVHVIWSRVPELWTLRASNYMPTPDANLPSPKEGNDSLRIRWGVLVVVLGVVVIYFSVTRFHEEWKWGKVFYDLGMAIITVGLVELILLNALRALAMKKTAMEELLENFRRIDAKYGEKLAKISESLKELQLEDIQNTVNAIREDLVHKGEELKNIRRKVDPGFDSSWRDLEEEIKRGKDEQA